MRRRGLRFMLTVGCAAALVTVAPEARGGGGQPITFCGETVVENAFLTQDLDCSGTGQNGVNVGQSGITIDLKGFRIISDRTLTYGIDDHIGLDGVTVKNGVLRNFFYGVYGNAGADSLTLNNVLTTGNVSDGILINGNAAKIQFSTATGNGLYGIRINGNMTRIQSSTASGNGPYGIIVTGETATIQSSTASGNFDGIRVEGNAAKVQSSTAISNAQLGVWIIGDAASVKSSRAGGNGGDGIAISGNAAKLTGNQAEANGYSGSATDLAGLGINVTDFPVTPPIGKNTGRGNDSPYECFPDYLC